MMQLTIISTGMEGDKTLTKEAADAIADADLLIGAERMLRPYRNAGKATFSSYRVDEIAKRLYAGTETKAALLVSGDCGFHSIAKQLDTLEGVEIRRICGISSPVYLAAKLGMPWEGMQFVSLHGAEENIAVHVRQNACCCFLLGGKMTAAKLCTQLCIYGLGDVAVHVGECLGYPEETITSGTASGLTTYEAQSLCTVIVENPSFSEQRHLSDADFVRTAIPMTKAEVRCAAVCALGIGRKSICYDIGCGTGSVSVEMALHCPDGKVYAIDRNADALRLTMSNARLHHCDNILPSEQLYPSETLPVPDKVFIGGSGGRMHMIFEDLVKRNPHVRIVAAAVTLETLRETQDAFAASGIPCSITQFSVTHTHAVGNYTMLSAQNPVFLLTGGGA